MTNLSNLPNLAHLYRVARDQLMGAATPFLSHPRPSPMANPFSDSPNARSESITTADGLDTFGVRSSRPVTRETSSLYHRSSTNTPSETLHSRSACPTTRARAGTWKTHIPSSSISQVLEDKVSLPCLMVMRESMLPSGAANIFTK